MLRQLEIKDVDQCASIHMKNSMEWSHNAKLGVDHLRNIYRTILGSEEGFGYGYFKDDQLVSFITATCHVDATNQKLYKLLSLRHYLKILSQIVTHPGELIDMLEAKLIMPRVIKRLGIKAFLLTWHNNFELKYNPFAPISVMNKVLEHLKEKGFKSAITQVDAGNDRPNIFYRKIKARVRYASRWNNIYEVSTSKVRPKKAENLREIFKIIEKENIPIDDLFKIKDMPRKEKFLRKYAAPIVGKLPLNLRYRLTTLAKKIRNPKGTLNLRYPLEFPECQKIVESLKDKDLRPWWGKKAVVCLCHDVDNIKGAGYMGQMVTINKKYDLSATINVLTKADYKLDNLPLQQWYEEGFEIGFHGATHDQGFAFRSPEKIREKLDEGFRRLSTFHPCGYRSPALSISKDLFFSLESAGFRYDSTLQVASPFYSSVRLPYPVYLSDYRIWELPLMIQDDNYFRDTKTSKKEIFTSLQRFVEEVKLLNGVCVINMHPHLMSDHPDFYEEFAQWLSTREDVAVRNARDVIEYMTTSREAVLSY